MVRRILAVSIIAALAMSSTLPARAGESDPLQEARDRAGIEALMWRYVRALDTLDAEAYAATYTEDGQFGTGRGLTKGREALRAMIEGIRKTRAEREAKGEPESPPMYHVITNSHVEFLGDGRARLHSYWMTVFGPAEQGSQPRIAAVGRGIDELVRVDGEWLIQSRDVAPQD